MRELTVEEIQKLAAEPDVRRIAVENFLMSMGDNASVARLNLRLDSNLYHWNHQTFNAILDGIRLADGKV